ncbi:MAG TPA: hypothetical protein VNE42_07810 [Acidimicrobiales bacterium]|nr:hypothetical protein [Acidimicrobiales bacterium]
MIVRLPGSISTDRFDLIALSTKDLDIDTSPNVDELVDRFGWHNPDELLVGDRSWLGR